MLRHTAILKLIINDTFSSGIKYLNLGAGNFIIFAKQKKYL